MSDPLHDQKCHYVQTVVNGSSYFCNRPVVPGTSLCKHHQPKCYRRLVLMPEVILGLLTPGKHLSAYEVIQDGVPEDAKVINVQHGWPNSVELLIESPQFSPVSEGVEIPALYPLLRVNTEIQAFPFEEKK